MEHNNKLNWHYTDTEGNPKEPGNYMVTVLYKAPDLEYWKNKGFAGKTVAEITKRHFGKSHGTMTWDSEWGMEGEKIWAWAEPNDNQFPDRLPENVVKEF